MFHTPAHKQAAPEKSPAQVFPAGSIVGPSEFDASDAPTTPRTLAEVAAIAEEIDAGINYAGDWVSQQANAFKRLLELIRSAVEAPVPSVAAAPAPLVSGPERACSTCAHWHTPQNAAPCHVCLPRAKDLPRWTPKPARLAEVDIPWAAVVVEN